MSVKRIEAVNDFVVKFANVNGSGSASANELFARSFLRMGIPVSPRNIFPSNIQGLPTWYEVRVTEKGWLGRRGGCDMMVAMNPQTWAQDVKEIEPGGYLFYDNTKPLPKSRFRDDIHVVGMPLTEISNSTYTLPRERQLFKNIIGLGALAALMDLEPEVIAELIGEQYKGKEKLLKPNLNALQLGLNYAREHLKDAIGLKAKRAYAVGDQIFMEGNAAAALGCVYGGATVCAWYPITPSSSVAEAFTNYCNKLRVDKDSGQNKFAIIQAEDELASIGIVTGAGWNGARAFTATSGPGISLMSEFIGLAYFAEIPATIIDVQRGGPSTGMPTRTQQSDVLACAYASHGDTKHVLLFPEDPHECFTMAADCLDLAERLQTPVFLMTDLDIGMNHRLCKPLKWNDARQYDRGKVMTAEMLDAGKEFARYKDLDGDGIPFRTYPGTHESKGAYFTRGTSKNPSAIYSEAGPDYHYNMQRLLKKHDFAKTLVPKPLLTPSREPARFGAIYYGSTSPSMHEALGALAEAGIFVNALRVRAFPFADEIQDFVQSHSKVFVIEQNRDAQMKTLLVNEAHINPASLVSILHYDGTPITARFITKEISEIVTALNVRPIKKDKAA
ncbi:MAG: 2-oxoacid:acceptor oxidoreductase subunit alpha [Betaproteobacteria bacterium]|nr:2-oxoacid:acceptor oxidoreductase subunit alpha [Betaproteobacteria bacterium]